MRDRSIARDRKIVPQTKKKYYAGDKPEEVLRFRPGDIIWWAKMTEREPFLTAARRISRSQTEVLHVVWPLEGEMIIEYKTKPQARRRE